ADRDRRSARRRCDVAQAAPKSSGAETFALRTRPTGSLQQQQAQWRPDTWTKRSCQSPTEITAFNDSRKPFGRQDAKAREKFTRTRRREPRQFPEWKSESR